MEASKPEKVYKVPNLTVDSIVTKSCPQTNEPLVLLITRGRPPFEGMLAFPGGFVDYGEDPKDAVLRELREECNVEGKAPRLVTVAGKPDRDPRKHVVSIVYHVQVDPTHVPKAGDDARTAQYYSLLRTENEAEMAFDHKEILREFMRQEKLL